MEFLMEKPVKRAPPDAPTRHTGIDILRDYLFAGGKREDFAEYARKKAA